MASFGTVGTLRQDLRTGFRHQDCVLELCGESPVAGANGPIVVHVQLGESSARIDHRFDGEAHSGKQSILATLPIGVVGNVRVLVEASTEPMSHIFSNDGESPFGRFCDHMITDDTYGATRF